MLMLNFARNCQQVSVIECVCNPDEKISLFRIQAYIMLYISISWQQLKEKRTSLVLRFHHVQVLKVYASKTLQALKNQRRLKINTGEKRPLWSESDESWSCDVDFHRSQTGSCCLKPQCLSEWKQSAFWRLAAACVDGGTYRPAGPKNHSFSLKRIWFWHKPSNVMSYEVKEWQQMPQISVFSTLELYNNQLMDFLGIELMSLVLQASLLEWLSTSFCYWLSWSNKKDECMCTLVSFALQSNWVQTQIIELLMSGIYDSERNRCTYRRESVWAHALGRAACRWVIKGDALMSL